MSPEQSTATSLDQDVRDVVAIVLTLDSLRNTGSPYDRVHADSEQVTHQLRPSGFTLLCRALCIGREKSRRGKHRHKDSRTEVELLKALKTRGRPGWKWRDMDQLGLWVNENGRLDYSADPGLLSVRLKATLLHDRTVDSLASIFLNTFERQVSRDHVQLGDLEIVHRDIELHDLETQQIIDARNATHGHAELPSAGMDEKLGDQAHPDAAIQCFRQGRHPSASERPGMVIEVGFSSPTPPKKCCAYLEKGGGEVRCVIALTIEYRDRNLRRSTSCPPPQVTLDAYRLEPDILEDGEEIYRVARFINKRDVRQAALAGGGHPFLDLTPNDFHHSLERTLSIHIPWTRILLAVDEAWTAQLAADAAPRRAERKRIVVEASDSEEDDDSSVDSQADYDEVAEEPKVRLASVPGDSRI
ncbi:hypothetical protein B0H63DRAFT_453459 [Podospora didyma]|uniref:Uncharacterized protein n=1 Tax=Podospora didyma TaxID=330526 RepID=A0AAE0N5Z9_9PEZI|nr:hypothetical protein B0H63DRAFT_453459 [Podospora didyma]